MASITRWKTVVVALILVWASAPKASAQLGVPAVPGLPGAPAAPAALVPAVPTALPAAPRTIWSFFGLSKANLASCKAKFCQSQLGLLASNGLKPISGLTGGLIPSNCCPPLSASQLAAGDGAGGDGPGSVASKIQADEAGAKARIAAIEYLASVDCHYWPEAGDALIKSLRTDRNECVRYAAARALGTGCCCTKDTVAALTIVVAGTDKDDNPAETSERVKAAAYYALQRCCSCVQATPPAPSERPGRLRRPENPVSYQPGGGEDGRSWLSPYRSRLAEKSLDQVLVEARRALADSPGIPLGEKTLPTGSRSMAHVLMRAANPPPLGARTESRPVARRAAPVDREVVPTAVSEPSPPKPRAKPPTTTASPQPVQRNLLGIFQASRKSRDGT